MDLDEKIKYIMECMAELGLVNIIKQDGEIIYEITNLGKEVLEEDSIPEGVTLH